MFLIFPRNGCGLVTPKSQTAKLSCDGHFSRRPHYTPTVASPREQSILWNQGSFQPIPVRFPFFLHIFPKPVTKQCTYIYHAIAVWARRKKSCFFFLKKKEKKTFSWNFLVEQFQSWFSGERESKWHENQSSLTFSEEEKERMSFCFEYRLACGCCCCRWYMLRSCRDKVTSTLMSLPTRLHNSWVRTREAGVSREGPLFFIKQLLEPYGTVYCENNFPRVVTEGTAKKK